jgi:hypothetical protein
MLSRLVRGLQLSFSIRLKGPTSQRQQKEEDTKLKVIRVEDFFADYSPETAEL